MIVFWDLHAWKMSHGMPPHIIENGIATIFTTIYYRLFRLLIGIIGSLTFISIFQNIIKEEHQPLFINICSSWGQYTLEIYILQSIIIERILSRYIDICNLNTYLYIIYPFISFMILYVCVYLSKLTRKNQLLRKTLWGKA